MKNAVVTGGSRGLGKEICKELRKQGLEVINLDIVEPIYKKDKKNYIKCDITKEGDLKKAKRIIESEFGNLDILVNNAAKNHHNFLEDVSEEEFMSVINVNVKGLFLTSKVLLPLLKDTKGTICNIVSNAAKTPMTASIAYNASKGAQLIMTRQMARELTKEHDITVFAVSPNKLDGTHMSEQIDEWCPEVRGWAKEYAKQYQLDALLTGEETDPGVVAEVIAFILAEKKRHKYLSGCNFEFGQ